MQRRFANLLPVSPYRNSSLTAWVGTYASDILDGAAAEWRVLVLASWCRAAFRGTVFQALRLKVFAARRALDDRAVCSLALDYGRDREAQHHLALAGFGAVRRSADVEVVPTARVAKPAITAADKKGSTAHKACGYGCARHRSGSRRVTLV